MSWLLPAGPVQPNATWLPSGENDGRACHAGQRQERHGPERRHALGGWRRLPRGVGGDKQNWHGRRPDPAPASRRSRGWTLGPSAGGRIRREVFERHFQVRHRLISAGRDLCAGSAGWLAPRPAEPRPSSVLGGAGSSLRIFASTARFESPTKGLRPVTISYRTAPKLKMSERASTLRPSACSGDIYAAVPTHHSRLGQRRRARPGLGRTVRRIEELGEPEVEDLHAVRRR